MPTAARARRSASPNGAIVAAELAEFPYTFAVVEIGSMIVDHDYQRQLSSLAKRIEEDFNPALVMTLCLSERTAGTISDLGAIHGGRYAVMDGQTRMAGCEARGITALPSLVYKGLTKADEARIFELLQTQRRNVTSWARFRAALVGKNEEAVAIKGLVESVGLEIGEKPGQIRSVAALEYGYRIDDFTLERLLSILKEAWPDRTPDSQFIRAMHYFLRRNEVDDERLVRRLKSSGAQDLTIRASHLRASQARVEGRGSTAYLAQAIKNAYQSGR